MLAAAGLIAASPPQPEPERPKEIALGKKLFFEPLLSADGSVSCATCHDAARAFTNARPVSVGIHGRAGQRNAPTVLNARFNKAQFWDGRAATLEAQAALPITNPSEMASRRSTPRWRRSPPSGTTAASSFRRTAAR